MQELLLAWFGENGRDLPWRRTRDPYAILVSEVMLQQTQVDRVVPRWLAWLERWPTVESLAAASTGGRDPRVAGARLQPARGHAARGRARRRRARLARRPDGAAGRRAVHRGGRRQLRVRPRRPAGRHERAAGAGAHGRGVRRKLRAGALRPRRDDLPRRGSRAASVCPLAGACPSRGSRYEPLRKQSRFEGSFRQRRANALRAVAAGEQPTDGDAVVSLERDGLVVVTDGLVALPR